MPVQSSHCMPEGTRPPTLSPVASLTAAEWSRGDSGAPGTGSSCEPFAEGPGKGGQGCRPWHSGWAPRAVVGPWCPWLLAPGHVSRLTAGCSGEEEHSPGSTGLCRGCSAERLRCCPSKRAVAGNKDERNNHGRDQTDHGMRVPGEERTLQARQHFC